MEEPALLARRPTCLEEQTGWPLAWWCWFVWPHGAWAGSWRWQQLGGDVGLSHRVGAPTEAARGL